MELPHLKDEPTNFNLVALLGATATGKTKLAAFLAKELNGEIISADSRQVYKYMDIGTGKDLSDYIVDIINVPYHLINIAEPTEEYNLYRFKSDFYQSFEKIKTAGKMPFLVGGTGMYLSAILQNYKLRKADLSQNRIEELENCSEEKLREILLNIKPKQHNITDLITKERIIKAILIEEANQFENIQSQNPISSLNIGIKLERNEIKRRITNRLKKRLDEGMIDEVKNLSDMGITHNKLSFFGLEYKFISQHLRGELNYNDMYQKLNSAIHSFAKRQMTWFRKMEREGVNINWFDGKDYNAVLSFIKERMEKNAKPFD
ncbi:MAG: tRNA (adenosine(37)-N6)-dimethylallyltransferase MiaA [Bacteroidetes bacterium]|nr:tRNA (adenosine(37)-N6)-dimethylallyltransferase MiaA [Bacteroidota bacterium]MCH8032659.1 tRNA (adenosine(37)-N6)-dimethylallyltransferase MiaA [Bacteroidota bacterium]